MKAAIKISVMTPLWSTSDLITYVSEVVFLFLQKLYFEVNKNILFKVIKEGIYQCNKIQTLYVKQKKNYINFRAW